MSPFDPLRLLGWAMGGGLFLSLLAGVVLRLRALRQRQRREHPLTEWLPAWQQAIDKGARRLGAKR